MAQKSNLLTLRSTYKNLNLLYSNKKIFGIGLLFLKNLISLFNRRNIFLINSNLNLNENKINLNLIIFFKTIKIINLKKKNIKRRNQRIKNVIKKKKNFFLQKFYQQLFFNNLLLLRNYIGFLKIKNLNLLLQERENKILQKKFYYFYKKIAFSLFPRRFNFFIDSIKITTLFLKGFITTSFFIKILGNIFKILQKRKHVKFLYFIKKLFKNLLITQNNVNSILGIKCRINGKLRGKTRSSTCCIFLGQVPNQSVNKFIDYAKTHVFTVYGVFGFKLWVYRDLKLLNN
jgi:hypothetical protein